MVNPVQEVFQRAVSELAQDLFTSVGGTCWEFAHEEVQQFFLNIARDKVRLELAKSGMV